MEHCISNTMRCLPAGEEAGRSPRQTFTEHQRAAEAPQAAQSSEPSAPGPSVRVSSSKHT